MNKKIWLGFYFALFVSLLFGCQAQNEVQIERTAAFLSDVLEIEDEDTEKPEEIEEAEESEALEESEELEESKPEEEPDEPESLLLIEEDGQYTSKDEVALYIHTYNKLPSNYITKKDAQAKGWNSKENTMAKALPGRSIGGDNFGNYEGLLPKEKGRTYKECDIDYVSGGRNAKRIVFSNDGLIFYTEDHYATFEQLY